MQYLSWVIKKQAMSFVSPLLSLVSPRFSVYLVILFFIQISSPINLYALQPPISEQKTISIDISELLPFYETLPADEKEEQIRDWTLYGLLAKLNLSEKSVRELLQGTMPMRYKYLKNLVDSEISPGRIKYITDKDCIMILSDDRLNDKSLIGSILDERYSHSNYCPELVHLFGYKVDCNKGIITVSYNRTIPVATIFSKEYNYFEKEVRNLEDFKCFVSNIDDITLVKWKEKSIVFGGRKYPEEPIRALSLEDIAILYKAYNVVVTPEKEKKHKDDYNRFINQKYEEVLRQNKQLKKAVELGQVKRAQIIEKICGQIPYMRLNEEDIAVGFSLDSDMDYNSISEDLIKLSAKDAAFISPQDIEMINFIDSNKESIVISARNVRMQNSFEPVLILMRKYNDSQKNQEKRFYELLRNIEQKNTYQTARYDGRIQGSSPGMILFYTDLIAKLWALDYNSTAPKDKITGFRTMSEIKVPKLYWADFRRLSKTRLWFGLRQESFEVYDKKILFAPIATKVYAASSDPLFPGKETMPNFQSGEFLSWWDRHYLSVADYEPQFHRLNQIQKWSCVMVILKEKKLQTLDFLHQVKTEQPYDFEAWYRDTNYLRIKTTVPFLDKKIYNRKTECLSLLSSRNYSLMGQGLFLSGGVSLASKKDIIQKLKRKTTLPAQVAKKEAVPPVGMKGNTTKITKIQEPIRVEQASKPEPENRVEVITDKKELRFNYRANNMDYGNLLVEKKEPVVKLKWDKNIGVLLNELLDNLVEIQQTKQPGYKDERIFGLLQKIEGAIRVEEGRIYFLKIKDMNLEWICLSINEQDKVSDYPAKSAGTEMDSDIFYGKVIANEQVNKILEKKNTVKIR